MEGMEEIVQEFLVESHENLDQLDQDLLALERDPNSRELLSSIFRTLHTIKGTSLDDSRWCLRGLNRGAGGSWSSGSAGG